jgi:hypothetical protein
MSTVGQPAAIELGPPASVIMSPIRAAGAPPMYTVALPIATVPPTWGEGPFESGHA